MWCTPLDEGSRIAVGNVGDCWRHCARALRVLAVPVLLKIVEDLIYFSGLLLPPH